MARTKTPNTTATELSSGAIERIAAAALEHPDLGARRLCSLLLGEGIKLTEGDAYRVLSQRNLQTLELRLRLLEERHVKEGFALSDTQLQALHKFNPCLRERLLDSHRPGRVLIQDAVGLGNLRNIGRTFLHVAIDPSSCLAFAVLAGSADPAAAVAVLKDRALAFFMKEGIAVREVVAGHGVVSSAAADGAYELFLKSRGIALALPPADGRPLNGFIERFERSVRKEFLAKISRSQMFQSLEALKPGFEDWLEKFNRETAFHGYPLMGRIPFEAFRTAAAPKVAEERPEPETDPISFHLPVVAPALSPPAPRADENPDWEPGRRIWAFRAVNAALICLIIYFGWMAAAMLLESRQLEGALIATATPPSTSSPILDEAHDKAPALDEYHVVWERNLFGGSRTAEAPMKPERVDVDKIAVAGKDVGLKLIGTVVANDPKLNYAVIELVKAGNQAIFREDERAESVLIKRIFRNNVIIVTSTGERRLTTDETRAISAKTLQGEPQANGVNIPEVPGAGAEEKEVTLEIPRNEIAKYLPAISQMLKESNSAPNISDGNPDGFAVGRLRAHDLFFRMGLRSGDVIKEVNGEEIESPDDVVSLIQGMASGGQFSVVIRRLGQMQQLTLSTN
jgi:general secretion pathway protein C